MNPVYEGNVSLAADRSARDSGGATHKFLIHHKQDHVGVATSDIQKGEKVIGVFMDDQSSIEVVAKEAIPLGHKIAIKACQPNGAVLKYGIQIGISPNGFDIGDYVHTHNLKTARW
ncbi:MAG: UxaA family hydrolase [Bacillaceae bacterium]|nr:UxaA family hydrolase [Bacillaceae bacterium]